MIRKARIRTFGLAILFLSGTLMAGMLQGCSVVMAARQPNKKDLSVLEKGTPRAVVRRELGWPVEVDDPDETHGCHETYLFEQGYSGVTKASRAVFHLTADIFTFALWELVGTPTEAIFDGTDVRLEVLYDDSEHVEAVCVYTGERKVKSNVMVSPWKMREMTAEDTPAPIPALEPVEPPADEAGSGGARAQ